MRAFGTLPVFAVRISGSALRQNDERTHFNDGQSERLAQQREPGIDIDQELTRQGFEAGAERELAAIVLALDATLERARVSAEDVDLVCLTGGTARVPLVQAALRARFGAERLHSLSGLHAVVDGLARHARWTLSQG